MPFNDSSRYLSTSSKFKFIKYFMIWYSRIYGDNKNKVPMIISKI